MTPTSYAKDSAAAGRHIMPDLVRSFAILGIALVNVAYFAYPGDVTYHDGGLQTGLDEAAYVAVNAFFLFKSYTLFSFMFGVGMAYQITSAQTRGTQFGPRYMRRLLGLLILGILHVAFAFIGDILIIYALLGAWLYRFKDRPVAVLKRWAIGFMIFQIAIIGLVAAAFYAWAAYDPSGMATEMEIAPETLAELRLIYGSGTFGEVTVQRLSEWREYVVFGLTIQGPFVMAFFLWGLAAVKSGVLSNPRADIWRKGRRFALPLGLVINIIGTALLHFAHSPMSPDAILGYLFIVIGSPFLTLGYLGLIAKWAQTPTTRVKTFMARGGTTTLTAYLMQSIILSLIFAGYGLGHYGKLGAFNCILIGAVAGVMSLICVSLWRKKFRYGPFEFLLRRFTYWGDNR